MPGQPKYTQTGRFMSLSTVLGENLLLVKSFRGSEALSSLFRFEIDLLSENDSIDPNALVGTNATLRINLAGGKPRFWNGHISRISQGWRGPVFTSYRAELVPWMWFLSLNRGSRIFQDKSTVEIVKGICGGFGFTNIALRLEGNSPKREYCVQYRESDLDFVMRLVEEEGIFFFFRHENGRHELVLGNSPAAHPVCPVQSTARCRALGGSSDEDFIGEWRHSTEYVPARTALSDFNFKTPRQSLLVQRDGSNPFESFDYPGLYSDKGRGETLNKIRAEESAVTAIVPDGESTCRWFASGHRFQLKDHYRSDWNQPYVILSVDHEASQAGSFQGDEDRSASSGEFFGYRNRFRCFPHKVPFRPPRRTPRPTVEGCQTAIVVGPDGEEIYTDEYGRVKVQFHWDRDNKRNQESSCWIRVAQAWAGNRWGFFHLPRVGEEVVVDFLEGNPDQPLIVGSVYNAAQMPPYVLPGEKTKTVLKTNSTKGGDGFNEVRLEDLKGQEQIFIHAERNFDLRVKNDRMDSIGGMASLTVDKDWMEAVDGSKHLTVKGDQSEKVDGTASLSVDTDLQQKIGGRWAIQAGTDVHIKSGVNLVIESGTTLTLKVGGSFVSLSSTGVAINGPMIQLNSGGTAGTGAGSRPNLPKHPTAADKAAPGQPIPPGPQAQALRRAAENGAAFCDL